MKYTVKSNLHHDGKLHEIGASIELTEEQAAALPVGVVEAAEDKPAKAKKAAEPAQE